MYIGHYDGPWELHTCHKQVDMFLPLLRSSSILVCQEPLVKEHRVHWGDVWLRQQLPADIQKALRSIPFLRTTRECQTSVYAKDPNSIGIQDASSRN